MFKEIFDEIVKVTAEIVKLPDFIDKKPLDLINMISTVYDLSTNTEDYKRIIISEDQTRIYIVYDGLGTPDKDGRSPFHNDTVIYKGKICSLSIMDYSTLFNPELFDQALDVLLILIQQEVLFLQAANLNMFYKNSQTLHTIFDQAPIILFINLAFTLFEDNDVLRKYMNKSLIKLFKDIDDQVIDAYVELIKGTPIDSLLDGSLIGAIDLISSMKEEKSDESEESV